MKHIIIFIVIVIFSGCASVKFAGPETGVVNLPGMSKSQSYQKAIQWITYKFVSGRAVIDYKDPGTGRIIAKGILAVPMLSGVGGTLKAKIVATIDCIDGKSRISIEIAECASIAGDGSSWPCNSAFTTPGSIKDIESKVKDFAEDYTKYMSSGAAPAWDGK